MEPPSDPVEPQSPSQSAVPGRRRQRRNQNNPPQGDSPSDPASGTSGNIPDARSPFNLPPPIITTTASESARNLPQVNNASPSRSTLLSATNSVEATGRNRRASRSLKLSPESSRPSEVDMQPILETPQQTSTFRRRVLNTNPSSSPNAQIRLNTAMAVIEAQSTLQKRGRVRRGREEEEAREAEELEALQTFAEQASSVYEPAVALCAPEPVAHKLAAAESSLYFYPTARESAASVLERRRPQQAMEEDGLFVPVLSEVPWFNWSRMDYRIRRCEPDQGKAWLGADGRLKITPDVLLPNPRRQVARPLGQTQSLAVTMTETPVPSDARVIDMTVEEGDIHDLVYKHKPTRDQDAIQEKMLQSLVLSLQTIRFTDHPLMTEECRLSARIAELVDQLDRRCHRDRCTMLEKRLLALREEYVRFKEHYARYAVESQIGQDEFEERCLRYLRSIQDTQSVYENESKEERLLEWNILKGWEKLKAVRIAQKFTSSSLRVMIKKKDTHRESEEAKLESYMQMALKDEEEMYRLQIQKEQRAYEKLLHQWEERQKRRASLGNAEGQGQLEQNQGDEMSSSRRRRRQRDEGDTASEVAVSAQDLPLQNNVADPKPVRAELQQFDREEASQKLARRMASCFRQPGTPIMSLIAVRSEMTTNNGACPKLEQLRRAQITETGFFIKLLSKRREILKSTPMPLDLKDFSASFQNSEYGIFTVQTNETPRDLKLEIWQEDAHGVSRVCQLPLELPAIPKLIESMDQEIQKISFDGSIIPPGQLHAVDSYLPTAVEAAEQTVRVTHGSLELVLAWDVDENGKVLAPKKPHRKQALREITDPNELKLYGDSVFKLNKRDHTLSVVYEGPVFRLNPFEGDLRLGNNPISRRNQILMLRQQEKIVTKKPVPINDLDITKDIYQIKEEFPDVGKQLEFKFLSPTSASSPLQLSPLSPVSTTRGQQMSVFLKKIRTHQMYMKIREQQMKRPVTFEEFVREEKLAEAAEGSFLEVLFRHRRPLKPLRQARTNALVPIPSSCQIVAQIISGYNIPLRTADLGVREKSPKKVQPTTAVPVTEEDDESKELAAAEKKRRITVRPYVEVQFQRKRDRTSVSHGANPNWNETLILPFHPPNDDFRPEYLQNIRDNIYFNIFDEFTVNMNIDDRDQDRHIHQRKERNWLGTLTVPFSTVYQQLVLDGRFHVQTPVILNGYQKLVGEEEGPESTSDATMLSIFLTLEPSLPQPKLMQPKFESREDEHILKMIQRWKTSIPSPELREKVVATAIDLNGKTTLITRYIRPQAPPVALDTIDKALAFVSMIPYIEDRTALSASVDLWSTSDQLIEIGAGDECEHAILLCNYFLYLNAKACVVLGTGVPEGKSAYVLTEETVRRDKQSATTSLVLYNPLNGNRYLPTDSNCSLTKVYCVFNDKNIWANIQDHRDPARVNFTLENSLLWKPLFGPGQKPNLASVQMEVIPYQPTNAAYCRELERELGNVLISKIEKWRGRFVTKWNRNCCRVLERLLPSLEADRQGTSVDFELAMAEFKKIQTVYRVRGFPLNFPFTDVDAVVEAVYNTDVHSNEDYSAEFAVAVHCSPFVNGLCSLWIYVASLARNQPYGLPVGVEYPTLSREASPTKTEFRRPMSALGQREG